MASKWFTTLDESRAQFGGYNVNPENTSERILTRIFYGIDKVAFPTLRATLDATEEVTDPKVDNQIYTGTWRIKNISTKEGEGEFAGSLTVYQDIANELHDGQGTDNERLAGMQSQIIELIEYRWMTYQHYKKTVTKKWTNLTSDASVTSFDNLSQVLDNTTAAHFPSYSYTVEPTPAAYRNYPVYVAGATADEFSAVYNSVVKVTSLSGYYFNWPVAVGKYVLLDTFVVAIGGLFLTGSEIKSPTIENCYYQEEKDHSFTLYRALSEIVYPAIMREIYYQYGGLIVTSHLPVEDANTIKLSGFLNATEDIYKNARFRIGGDTYRITADATCVASAVTLAVTPPITAATEAAHTADPANSGAQVFFNALG